MKFNEKALKFLSELIEGTIASLKQSKTVAKRIVKPISEARKGDAFHNKNAAELVEGIKPQKEIKSETAKDYFKQSMKDKNTKSKVADVVSEEANKLAFKKLYSIKKRLNSEKTKTQARKDLEKLIETHKQNIDAGKIKDDKELFETVFDKFKESYKDKLYKRIETDLDMEIKEYGANNKELENLTEKGNYKEINKRVNAKYNIVVGLRQSAWKDLNKRYNFSFLDMATGTLDEQLSKIYVIAKRTNSQALALKTEEMYKFLQDANKYDVANKVLHSSTMNVFKKLEPEKQLKYRKYIESFDINKLTELETNIGMMNGKKYEVDIDKLNELGLTKDDVPLLNKTINSFRFAKMMHKDVETGVKTIDRYPYSVDDIPDDIIVGKNLNLSEEVGDVGVNYFPTVITDKYKEHLRKNTASSSVELKNLNTDFGINFVKSKAGQVKDEHRLLPSEEIDHYFKENFSYVIKNRGRDQLGQLKNATIMTNFIAGHNNEKFVVDQSRHLEPLIKTIEQHWEDINSYAPKQTGLFNTYVQGATDYTTIWLLAKSPRMWAFNMLQTLTNSSNYKGIGNTLKAYRVVPSMMKGYAKEEGLFKKIWGGNNLINAREQLKKDHKAYAEYIDYYFRSERPDILMQDIYNMDKETLKIFNHATMPFKFSDMVSRSVGIVASVDFAKPIIEDIYKQHSGNYARIGRELVKRLHLFEFNSLQTTMLLKNYKDPELFLKEYVKLSVDTELFNYSRYSKPHILDAAKKHPELARALRFISWNLYYANVIKGLVRTYNAGDTAPIKKLLALSTVWFGTMAMVSGLDNKTISSIASYGLGRTPFIAPSLNIFGIGFRDMAGISAAPYSVVVYPAVKTIDFITDAMQGTKKNKDSFDWLENELKGNIKSNAVIKTIVNLQQTVLGD